MPLAIQRRFTRAGESPYAAIPFRLASSEIRSPDGSVVFRLDQLEAPSSWSQVAIDVLAQKYFRKAGVPARLKPVREKGVPAWLCRRVADERGAGRAARGRALRSARPAPRRCSTGWPAPGPIGAGRAAISPARTMPAPSSTSCATCWPRRWRRPTRRNGSTPACTGPTASTARRRATSTSTRPPARCRPRPRPTSGRSRTPASSRASRTIWSTRAASWICGCARRACSSTARAPAPTSRSLRAEGERLSGGGRSSGLMSFLKIGDRAAGAIKSGGTTRRAAKMVIVRRRPSRHRGVHRLEGASRSRRSRPWSPARGCSSSTPPRSWPPATTRPMPTAPTGSTRARTRPCARRCARRARRCCPRVRSSRSILYASQGYTAIEIPTYAADWDSDAYLTVSGQNSNNTVRVGDDFVPAVLEERDWQLIRRTDGKVAKTLKARRALGQDRRRRLGQRRPRHPVRHHDQRLAHLPGCGPDQRVEPVLGVHVPRRHGLQSGVVEPDLLPPRGRHAWRSTTSSTPSGCGRWCSRSRC